MTIHLFITEALVSAGMYTKVKQGGGPDNQRISYDHLLDQASFLSQVRVQKLGRVITALTSACSSSVASSSSLPRVSVPTSTKPSEGWRKMALSRSGETRSDPKLPGASYQPSSAVLSANADGRTLTFTVS